MIYHKTLFAENLVKTIVSTFPAENVKKNHRLKNYQCLKGEVAGAEVAGAAGGVNDPKKYFHRHHHHQHCHQHNHHHHHQA